MTLRMFALTLLFAGLSIQAQPVLTEDTKLIGSTADFRASAGWAIGAVDGFVVLGAFGDNSDLTTGAAYVFRETDGVWEEEVRLNASQQSFFTFGFSVAAWSGGGEEVALVGAYGDPSRPETDAAYVFRNVDGKWIQEARLTNGPESFEFFGRAVAIHGNYAVVGTPGADDVGGTTGAAYIFCRTTEDVWVEDARLVASDAGMKAGFGRGVAMTVSSEGVPTALIGAPSDDEQRGAAYAFRRTPDGMWVEEAKLVEPDPETDTGGLFGRAVSVIETPEGDILALAGELGDQDGGIQSGAGYVFRREEDGTWAFEEKLTAADGDVGQRLGWSVALAAAPDVGGTVAVLGGDGAYNFAGTVRLFRRTAGEAGPVWIEEAELWASDRASGDQIGYSVGASSRYAVAGAPFNDDAGGPEERGAGYVWGLQRAVPVKPTPGSPEAFALDAPYPNPARGAVTVAFTLRRAAEVSLEVLDVLGRRVAVLADGSFPTGKHALAFDTARLPAGVYVVRVSGSSVASRRFTVMR